MAKGGYTQRNAVGGKQSVNGVLATKTTNRRVGRGVILQRLLGGN